MVALSAIAQETVQPTSWYTLEIEKVLALLDGENDSFPPQRLGEIKLPIRNSVFFQK
ncbi:MAG: hypothetical protein LDL41_06905 [Coleofasciculus sp. S288]|nr:hypothetical protein [Coleofasciculus sp. S288]